MTPPQLLDGWAFNVFSLVFWISAVALCAYGLLLTVNDKKHKKGQ